MSPDIIIWAVAFVALTIVEMETFQFVSIWFALAALVTLFCAIADVPVFGQIVIFVIISTMLLICTRPLSRKLNAKKRDATNADLDVGKTATVIDEINNTHAKGRVKLSGVDWMARSSDDSVIQEGEIVVIEKIDGAKLIVRKQ